METTSYQYKALNTHSYNELVEFVIGTNVIVSIYPQTQTIVITPIEGDNEAFLSVGKFIDDKGLDFQINPIEVRDENLGEVIDNETTDANTLRKIIYKLLEQKSEQSKALVDAETKVLIAENKAERAENQKKMYLGWYQGAKKENDRVKPLVQSIATLLNSIYPENT